MIVWVALLALAAAPAYAQLDLTPPATPCWEGEGSTAVRPQFRGTVDMMHECGFVRNPDNPGANLGGAMSEVWVWVTGGWFAALFGATIIILIYKKYGNAGYATMVGLVMMPVWGGLFPERGMQIAGLLLATCVAVWIFEAYTRQTR